MPRPKLSRKICKAPEFRGFVPIDQKRDSIPVLIDIEEYEALRLCDNTMLGHKEAAAEMGVSRPTFTRIYESARRKVALAFVEARAIVFEGGKVHYDSDWFECKDCRALFSYPFKPGLPTTCALCNSSNIMQYSN